MLTIFTIPKPFKGLSKIHQRNAIKSWLALTPAPEITLVGSDEGVGETSLEFNLKHIDKVEKSELGTPLLSSAFEKAKKLASNKTLMYLNADIIIVEGLSDTLMTVSEMDNYIIVGRRYDITLTNEINFNDTNSKELLRDLVSKGKLHGYSGIDYLIFPRDIPIEMPPFVVGRPGWDNWFLWKAKMNKIPIIDATEILIVLHQNHDYSHSKYGLKTMVTGPESETNLKLIGGRGNMLTIREADFLINKKDKKIVSPPLIFRGILSILSRYTFWQQLMSFKRNIQKSLLSNH